MSSTAARDAVAPTCAAVAAVIADPPALDLHAETPCAGFDLRALVDHVVGTSTAMALLGLGQDLDADDPWGAGTHAADGDWAGALRDNLGAISRGWSRPEAWTGSVRIGGSEMPRVALGEMALVEVAMHGWDLARALGRQVEIGPEAAAAVDEAVAATADLGRRMGAYGPEVPVAADAPSLDRALGRAGRDPGWTI